MGLITWKIKFKGREFRMIPIREEITNVYVCDYNKRGDNIYGKLLFRVDAPINSHDKRMVNAVKSAFKEKLSEMSDEELNNL